MILSKITENANGILGFSGKMPINCQKWTQCVHFFYALMKNLSKRKTFFPQSIDKTGGGAIIDMSNGQFYPLPDIVRKLNKMPSRAKLDAILQERTKCQRHGVRRLSYNRAVITGGAAAPRAKAASAGDRMGTRHLPRGAAYACRCAHMGYRRETV